MPPPARPDGRRPIRRLPRDRRGAAGIEMALIILPLMMFIIGIIEVAYTLYAQQALDFALYEAVRKVATGQIQATANSLASFKSVAFCPSVGPFLPCASIAVTVSPASGYTASTLAVPMKNGAFNPGSFEYCPGTPGEAMIAQAVYPAPSFLTAFLSEGLSTYNGRTVRLITSTAGFVNEPYIDSAATPSGC